MTQAGAKLQGRPRDYYEAWLAEVWRDLLGLPMNREMRTEDDFFALGGDSLKTLRLLHTIEAELGTKVGVHDFLGSPTIAHISHLIRIGRAGTSNTLTRISQGKATPPFYCVHGASGEVIFLAAARHALRRSVYGFRAPGLVPGTRVLSDISGLAARYLRDLGLAARDRIILAGYSMGALIAYDMACRLQREAEHRGALAQLVLIAPARYPCSATLTFDELLAISLEDYTGSSDTFWELAPAQRWSYFLGQMESAAGSLPAETEEELLARKRVHAANCKAATSYTARTEFAGRAVLFVGRDDPDAKNIVADWQRLLPAGHAVVECNGTHADIWKRGDLWRKVEQVCSGN